MSYRLSIAALGLAAWLSSTALAADVEVLAKGPVHEAYAEPSEREPAATPVIPKEPPKAIEELPPDQKPEGDNVQWMPGYWAWDEEKKDHIWVSGFWRNSPPGRSWVPGSWRKTSDGWQWSGGFWAGAKEDKANIDYLPQPPAPLDNNGAGTPAPSENHTYVPGTWVWRDRYVWRPGFWAEHRPGWVWVSAHYRWTPAGYIFVDGYWDYPLAERGILFAPVYIPPVVYAAPAYVYTPTVIVREDCLYGAFFARRGFGCYYFGDYFGASYASLGFVSWCGHVSATVTIGGWHDPLFSYYRCGFRRDPYWGGGGINALYVGRYRGDYLRPPTTLVQQNTVINNITKNTTVNNINTNNVTMLSSLNDAGRNGRRNLQTVSDSDRKAQQQAARSVRDVADRRANMENELAAKPRAAGQPAGPRSLTLDVPKQPTAPRTGAALKGTDAGKGTPLPKSPTVGSASPPSPKPTPLGKVDPTPIGGNNPKTSTGAPSIVPKNPPLTPKLPSTATDGTPKLPVVPKSPAAKIDPPAPKSPSGPPPSVSPPVMPKSPSLPPATIPKANIPVVPRSSPPSGGPSLTPPKPVVPVRPAPAPARPAPKPTKPTTSMYQPAPSVYRGAAPTPAPRSYSPPVSRPAPSISRPPASIRPPVQAPARPAAPKKGKR